MSESTYKYLGPPSGVTLRKAGQDREIMLFPGKTVALPDGHPWVNAAMARGHLVPQPAETPRGNTRKARSGGDTPTDTEA